MAAPTANREGEPPLSDAHADKAPKEGAGRTSPYSPTVGGRRSDADKPQAPLVEIRLATTALEVGVGDIITIDVDVSTQKPLVDAPFHLLHDPQVVRFVDATTGGFLERDGQSTVFLANGHSRPGDVVIGVGRTTRSQGIEGAGTLCRVRFEAVAPGTTSITVGRALAWSESGDALPVSSASISLIVREPSSQ